jgi:hypothetical protein
MRDRLFKITVLLILILILVNINHPPKSYSLWLDIFTGVSLINGIICIIPFKEDAKNG